MMVAKRLPNEREAQAGATVAAANAAGLLGDAPDPDGLVLAVPVAQPAGEGRLGGTGLADAGQLHAALDRHAALLELLAEDALGLGLRQEQQERVCGVGDAGVVRGY